jgi:hypothetical protein
MDYRVEMICHKIVGKEMEISYSLKQVFLGYDKRLYAIRINSLYEVLNNINDIKELKNELKKINKAFRKPFIYFCEKECKWKELISRTHTLSKKKQ